MLAPPPSLILPCFSCHFIAIDKTNCTHKNSFLPMVVWHKWFDNLSISCFQQMLLTEQYDTAYFSYCVCVLLAILIGLASRVPFFCVYVLVEREAKRPVIRQGRKGKGPLPLLSLYLSGWLMPSVGREEERGCNQRILKAKMDEGKREVQAKRYKKIKIESKIAPREFTLLCTYRGILNGANPRWLRAARRWKEMYFFFFFCVCVCSFSDLRPLISHV